jgi:hypothetical protein
MKIQTKAYIAVSAFLALVIYIFIIRRKKTVYYTIADFNAANSRGESIPSEYLANAEILLEQVNIIQDELYKINPSYKMKFHSVYRSPAHNAAIGGATNSKHMQAKAIDFSVTGQTPTETQNFIIGLVNEGKIKNAGLGRGGTFTHYDYRDTKNVSWKYNGSGGSSTYSVPFEVMQRRERPSEAQEVFILQPIATDETGGDENLDI